MIFSLLLPIIKMIFGFFAAKDSNDTQKAIAALNATVEEHKSARAERTALWSSLGYQALIYLIVAPPALHMASIYMDTIFRFGWAIPKAPAPYDAWESAIVMGFVGVGGVVSSAVGVARQFRR